MTRLARFVGRTFVTCVLALAVTPLYVDAAEAQRVTVEAGRGRGRGPSRAVVVQPARPPRTRVVVQPPPRTHVVVQPTGRHNPRGHVVVGPRRIFRQAPARVVVRMPPPARPQVVVRTAPSAHGQLWIDGYWGWNGAAWDWNEGHWELPPQQGAVWIAPRVEAQGWVPGYWTLAAGYDSMPAAQQVRAYQVGSYVHEVLSANDPRDAAGSPYHDFVVSMQRGETASFVASGGPSDRFQGRRVDVAISVLSNGMPVANGSIPRPGDAQVTFTAPQAGFYTLRVSSLGGQMGTGSYVLESSGGAWNQQVSPYDQFWGAQANVNVQVTPQQQFPQQQYVPQPQQQFPPQQFVQPQQQPIIPDCRSTLLQMGHAASNLMFCDGVEPYCADALLRRGHAPTNLMFCEDVNPECAVQLLQRGGAPTELQFCH